ncbi:MAG: hypothetical protein ACK5ZG_11580 [Phycisphaerae bacterium]|jgi:Spy/CpxP family protein refolding chaperone
MMRGKSAVGVGIAGAWTLWVSIAMAQVSPRPAGTEWMPVQPATREDVMLLAEYIDATPEQQQAIEQLTTDTITRMREVTWEYRRAERRRIALKTPPTMTNEQHKEKMRAAEMQWLENCWAVVDDANPEQVEGWRRFEMSRTRLLTGPAGRWDVRLDFDPGGALAIAGVDEDEYPALKAKLITWERDHDAALRAWLVSVAEYDKLRLDRASYEQQNTAAGKSSERLLVVAQMQVKGYRGLMEIAPEAGRKAMRLMRARRLSPWGSRSMREHDGLREMFAIEGLSEETRAKLMSRLGDLQREIDALIDQKLQVMDDRMLAAKTLDESRDPFTGHELDREVDTLAERALMDMEAALTPAEREAYARVYAADQVWGDDPSDEWRHDYLRKQLREK